MVIGFLAGVGITVQAIAACWMAWIIGAYVMHRDPARRERGYDLVIRPYILCVVGWGIAASGIFFIRWP